MLHVSIPIRKRGSERDCCSRTALPIKVSQIDAPGRSVHAEPLGAGRLDAAHDLLLLG